MSNTFDLNEAVLQSLGLSAKGQNITEVTLTLKNDQYPTAHITRVLLDMPAPRYTFDKVMLTNVKPIEPIETTKPAPFDLDALCTRARMRLHNAIDHDARNALHHIARGFLDARIACDLPLREHHKRHMTDAELEKFYEVTLHTELEPILIFKNALDDYRFNHEGATA